MSSVSLTDSHAGLLRCARAEVIPQIPDLAPKLENNPNIIRDAICDELVQRGLDPSTVSEADLNKAERHSIAGFLIGQQREQLVEGTGSSARLRAFPRTTHIGSLARRLLYPLIEGIDVMLDSGARQVEEAYTNGPDPEHAWWPAASKRYTELGLAADEAAPTRAMPKHLVRIAQIPNEGIYLRHALRTRALSSAVPSYIRFIRKLDAPTERRLQAAHDLIHILTTPAGLHFVEFAATNTRPINRALGMRFKGNIVFDEASGHYKVQFPEETKPRQRNTYARLPRRKLPNATLKCPAHASIPGIDSTNLQTYAHALVNEAAELGML